MGQKPELIVGLDIGTTKICVVVGEISAKGTPEIVGVGQRPSKGMRKGVVINIESTVAAIKQAVQDAATMAGCEISQVYAGIAGGHIKGFNSHGIVAVKDKEVSPSDLGRVIDAARAVPIATEREILHILPQEYVIDQQDGIKEPLGMSGSRLEARVHIVTGANSSRENIVKCARRCGLSVADLVLEPLASSYAVLGDDEKDLGVALIDIGGGTTDLAVWVNGSIAHTSVLAIGGDHITADVAVGLRTPLEHAEQLKVRHGCAMGALVGQEETVEVKAVGGGGKQVVSRRALTQIIEPRVEEMFNLVRSEIEHAGGEHLLVSGVVITGGSTLLAGMREMAEDILGLPVRIGMPDGLAGLNHVVRSPKFATAVGLVIYGQSQQRGHLVNTTQRGMYHHVKHRMSRWLGEIF